ncbi:unnamed protein product [Callosobruchus maculatus]|uniref:SWIM-type domain-containing protein n=1 Tax=Callosobruchus maculatus TaxID=64391 RepID=A0A653DGR8_CALMS|nr:unnamed protein product [Callosobruchus maculatus]
MEGYNKSHYLLDLERTSKEAAEGYLEKIKLINFDPFSVEEHELDYDIEAIPNVTAADVVSYLVLTHKYYTKEQMIAYKSLKPYKYFKAGCVGKIGSKHIKDYVLLITKVQASIETQDAKLKVWVLVQADGEILTAHCTCMVGLGEACDHIIGVSYAVEHIVSKREFKQFIARKATLPNPTHCLIEPTAAQVADMDWGESTVKRLETELDVPALDMQGIQSLLEDIEKLNCRAALMRVVPPFCDRYEEQVSLPSDFDAHDKADGT